MTYNLTLNEVAARINGVVHGDGSMTVTGIKPLENAGKGELSFFSPKTKKNSAALQELARTTEASLLVSAFVPGFKSAQIVTRNPYLAAVELAPLFYPPLKREATTHPTAIIGANVKIGSGVHIGPYAVIGDGVTIGDDVTIHPHVVIYDGARIGSKSVLHASSVVREHCILGEDCLLQSGVVVGGDGFGYIPDPKLGHKRIPHSGIAVLEERVDLGANTTVDRATFGETRIRAGAKLDNLVMIGHNTVIGKNNFLCSQVGVSGSVITGDNVILAGQVGVADHLTIGSNSRAAGQAGITNDIEPGIDVSGHPARLASEYRRETAALKRLPKLLVQTRRFFKGRDESEG